MARREVPNRNVLMANMQKIQTMHDKMQENDLEMRRQQSINSPLFAFLEPLTCIVCMELAKEPTSCPKCQAICCNPCLEKWFGTQCNGPASVQTSKKICPGCRTDLSQVTMATNRLADSLIKAIQKDDTVVCKKHNSSEILFYCKTCEEPLCTDAIVEETFHRQHDYIQLNKVYSQAKSKIDGLIGKYADLRDECHNEIARYEKVLQEERFKNETKLGEFMRQVDEKLKQFQADEETESARLQSHMNIEKVKMEELEESENRIRTRLAQLTKIDIVKEADGIIEDIELSLKNYIPDDIEQARETSKRQIPKATSAEDLFNLIPAPSIEDVADIQMTTEAHD